MNATSIRTGLFVLTALCLAPHIAHAQVVSPGPYYATPSWDQTFACTAANCPRFILLSNLNSPICDPLIVICVPGPAAVLDRETGLVWERFPDSIKRTRRVAASACHDKVVGGRKGWRLPSISELTSLVDASRTGPALPEGHPFINIKFGPGIFNLRYWSSSAFPAEDVVFLPPFGVTVVDGEAIDMQDGSVGTASSKESQLMSWCVRGAE